MSPEEKSSGDSYKYMILIGNSAGIGCHRILSPVRPVTAGDGG